MRQIVLMAILTVMIAPLLWSQSPDSLNMRKIDHWDNDALPSKGGVIFNEVWGYSQAGREYAILGGTDSVYIFDVTTVPMQQVFSTAGGDTTIWRDMKTYDHYLYSVSDRGGEGMIVVDMANLPSSASVVGQYTDDFLDAHNIYIEESESRLYVVGTDTESNGVIIYDLLSSPGNPTLLASVNLGELLGDTTDPGKYYIHDIYVRDNIAYASHGYSGFFVWDFTDPNDIQLLGSIDPDGSGYHHSSWLTDDGMYALGAEEVPQGRPLTMVDVSDPSLMTVTSSFKKPLEAPSSLENRPHNPYIIGDKAYVSYYEDGVQVLGVADPTRVSQLAYYDTEPRNDGVYNGFKGCWGVYPFLPSGKILASDVENGLFVLELDFTIPLTRREIKLNINPHQKLRANLTWKTSSQDISAFSIFHSKDGNEWEHKGKISHNNREKYSWSDSKIRSGMSYYKIAGLDKEGQVLVESNVVQLEMPENDNWRLISNLISQNELEIIPPSELTDHAVQMTIYRTDGVIIQSNQLSGIEAHTIDFSMELPSGNYLVSISQGNKIIWVEKFIKL